MTPLSEMASRNEQILEAAKNGANRRELAVRFDLTPVRISQIVNQYGFGWR
jgi:hypothetical protein